MSPLMGRKQPAKHVLRAQRDQLLLNPVLEKFKWAKAPLAIRVYEALDKEKDEAVAKALQQLLNMSCLMEGVTYHQLRDRVASRSKDMPMPSLKDAIEKVATIYHSGKGAPDDVLNSPEPCRAIAYHCGYEVFDGTPWWDMLMDGINCWEKK